MRFLTKVSCTIMSLVYMYSFVPAKIDACIALRFFPYQRLLLTRKGSRPASSTHH